MGGQGGKGILSTDNSNRKGPELWKLRVQGRVPFPPVPESSVESNAHRCPCPLVSSRAWSSGVWGGQVGAGVGVGWELTTRELDLPCLRHTCSRRGGEGHRSSSRLHSSMGLCLPGQSNVYDPPSHSDCCHCSHQL